MRSLPLLFALFALITVGCADPAADAPDAVVEEPAAAPEPVEEAVVATTYAISPDSKIDFVGSKVTGAHEGGFKSFTGSTSVTDGTPEGSSVEVTIDMTSLWSDNDNLTGHLKSDDFFGVETYPTASFTSTEIAAAAEGGYTLTGNLDLHGVTKQISFPATIEVNDQGFSANAEFSINRMDFGIVYAGKADDLIREEVLIKLDLRSASEEAAGGDADAGDGEAEAGA